MQSADIIIKDALSDKGQMMMSNTGKSIHFSHTGWGIFRGVRDAGSVCLGQQ